MLQIGVMCSWPCRGSTSSGIADHFLLRMMSIMIPKQVPKNLNPSAGTLQQDSKCSRFDNMLITSERLSDIQLGDGHELNHLIFEHCCVKNFCHQITLRLRKTIYFLFWESHSPQIQQLTETGNGFMEAKSMYGIFTRLPTNWLILIVL